MGQREINERRYRIINIGYESLVALLRGDIVITGLPHAEDIRFIAANHNFASQSIEAIIEHQSFTPVSPGHLIPPLMDWGVRRVVRLCVREGSSTPEELLAKMKWHSQQGALVIVEWRDEVKTANE